MTINAEHIRLFPAYERREKLAGNAVDQHSSLLEQNRELRDYAKQSLAALAERTRIPLYVDRRLLIRGLCQFDFTHR
jgi:hypothetical protein